MCKKVKKAVRKQDLFGEPVMLTFNGETHFKTWQGGLISIIIVLGLASAFGFRIYQELNAPEFIRYPSEFDNRNSTVQVPWSDNIIMAKLKVW